MKKIITTLEYVLVLVAGVLLAIGIFLEHSMAKSAITGLGIGLYNGVFFLLIDDVKNKEI